LSLNATYGEVIVFMSLERFCWRKRAGMRRCIYLVLMVVFCSGFCGCASRGDRLLLSQLIEELETEKAAPVEQAATDLPEAPDSGLPPPPGAVSADTVKGTTAEVGALTIQPDCLVQIKVDEDPTLDGSYPVNAIGAIELGRIGPIFLINRTEAEAEKKVREVLLSRDLRKATVRVRIVRASYDKVRMSGAVGKPGLIRIGAGDSISLNDALRRSGGLRMSPKGAKVKVVRDGLLFAIPDTEDAEEYSLVDEDGRPQVPEVLLRNNDIAYVYADRQETETATGAKRVIVLGQVRRPGVYSFGSGEPCTIMHLIFKMGGLPLYANKKSIKVIRRDEEDREEEIPVNAEEILEKGDPDKDVPLQNGDRVKVPARKFHLF